MKGIFKPKPKSPKELVFHARELLLFLQNDGQYHERKRAEKAAELGKTMLAMRVMLFGDGQTEPNDAACARLTQCFFAEDNLRILIACIPRLDLGARKNATHVIANFQRRWVSGQLIASEYLERNLDIMDTLLPGYEDEDIALTYGAISRECIRHQTVARYVLESDHMKKFFDYIQIPNFDIASDAQATFKELLTRHKSTASEFISANYDWFFQEYNSKLLESQNYITRRHAVKLLGDILLDRYNAEAMARYVGSLDNMRIMMNLFRDPNKSIRLETFQVFKLFVANPRKPPDVISVLVKNQTKLIKFLQDMTSDKVDENFESDKCRVIQELSSLGRGEPRIPVAEECNQGS